MQQKILISVVILGGVLLVGVYYYSNNFHIPKKSIPPVTASGTPSGGGTTDSTDTYAPSDRLATKETVALFKNLRALRGENLIFGQQLASFSGQGWVDKTGAKDTSDIKTAVGDAPGLYGINLGKGYTVGGGMGINKTHIINAYKKGAVVTIHMTMPNPVTLGDSHDFAGDPIASLMPGGKGNENFKKILDDIADLANSAEVDGVKVPLIFRPWHEMTGSWDWWGEKYSTSEQYIAAWRYMVDYLRNEKGVHNMLFAFAPSQVTGHLPSGGFDRYPGDAYVDVIGMDRYDTENALQGDSTTYTQSILADARFIVTFAEKHGKIAAITETGVKDGLQNAKSQDWFNTVFLTPLKADPVARKVVYFMTWTNSSKDQYWTPLQGQSNYDSFIKFYNDPYTLFAKDLPDMYK